MKLYLSKIKSPLGEILIATDEQERLRVLDFIDSGPSVSRVLRQHYGQCELINASPPPELIDCLGRYFEGEHSAINEIVTEAPGNELQLQVWKALREIPSGKTTSYGALAEALGYEDPRMAISVGAANASNPIAIVVPCHRVIAKNGELKGYAWGLHRKQWLLEHERALKAEKAPETARLPGF